MFNRKNLFTYFMVLGFSASAVYTMINASGPSVSTLEKDRSVIRLHFPWSKEKVMHLKEFLHREIYENNTRGGFFSMDITEKELEEMLENDTKTGWHSKEETEKKLNDFFKRYKSYGFGYHFTINDSRVRYWLKKQVNDKNKEVLHINVEMQRAFVGFTSWEMGFTVIIVLLLILGSIYYFRDKLSPSQEGKKAEKDKK